MYGKNGSTTYQILKKNKNFKLVTLTENRLINRKKFNGIKPELNSDKAFFKKTDVIIDFTVPTTCTLEIKKIASKLRKKSSGIGTIKPLKKTGF